MTKLAFALSFLIMLPVSAVFAESSLRGDVKTETTLQAQVRSSDDQNQEDGVLSASTSLKVNEENDSKSATGTQNRDREQASTTGDSEESNNDEDLSSSHRSAVSDVVRSLLADSERDDGIGEEVRAIAQSQDEAASTTAEAMAKVEGRSKIWSVLFGTDWKNIGTLRSQIAKTDADAARLETALSKATDTSVKADLTTQLSVIKAEQAKVADFVDTHEKAFSFFGWLTKLFVGGDTTATATATTTAAI